MHDRDCPHGRRGAAHDSDAPLDAAAALDARLAALAPLVERTLAQRPALIVARARGDHAALGALRDQLRAWHEALPAVQAAAAVALEHGALGAEREYILGLIDRLAASMAAMEQHLERPMVRERRRSTGHRCLLHALAARWGRRG